MSRLARGATPHALALAAVALTVLATFEGALRPSRVLYERDIHAYFYPQRAALQAAVAQGSVPLWNPWVGFGGPFLADASAELAYLPTWLLLPLPVPLQFDLFATAHCLLAAVGAAALARRLFASALAAGVAGVGYALAGPLLSAVGLYHHFAGASLLPWVLWALEGLLRRPGARQALILGALAALQILAGSLDLVLMTGLAAAGRLLLELRRLKASELRKVAASLALAAGLALALGAVQWLPTVERGLHGLRAVQDMRTRTYWSLHPDSLADLAVPRLVSDSALSSAEREVLFEGREPLFACLYVGVLTLTLAGLALILAPASCWPLGVGLGGFLLLSLGRHTPLYALLLQLPGFSLLRYPQKYLLPGSLWLALLAAAGAVAYVREWAASDVRRARAFVVALLLLALLLAIGSARASGHEAEAVGALKLGRSALLLAFAALVLWRRSTRAQARPGPLAALLVVGALDLVIVGRGTNPTAPSDLYAHRPEVLDRLRPVTGRLYAASSPGCLVPDQGPAGYDRSAVAALGFLDTLRPPTGARFGLFGSYDGEFTGLGPRWSASYAGLLQDRLGTQAGLRLLQLGGVEYVLLVGREAPTGLEPVATLKTPYVCPLQLLRVPQTLPTAFVVGHVRFFEGDGLAAVLDPSFDPRAEVLLEGGASPAESEASGDAPAQVAARTPDTLELLVDLRAAGVLVVTEAFDDGWLAVIDGRPVPVLRANGLFRAVRLTAGKHRVIFRYRPGAVVAGASVSALGLLAAGSSLAWSTARRHGLSRA